MDVSDIFDSFKNVYLESLGTIFKKYYKIVSLPELELVGGHEAEDGGGEAPLLVADNLRVGRVVIRARAGLQQPPGQLPRLAVDFILIPEPTKLSIYSPRGKK